MEKGLLFDWILRFVKGIFIGSGFILPGVSGGALAAVFGIYERMITFVANITKDFKKNFIFFIPVGLGGAFGVFVLSFAISYFLDKYNVQVLWFFIGCILGVLPSLIKEAGKKGRKPIHIVLAIISTIVAIFFLYASENSITTSLQLNFFTWILAGALIGLGMIIPGLSPSNFLVFLNMYKPMTDGIKNVDFMVIIPLGLGAVITVLSLSKLINFIFKRAYAGLFHFILGVVFASTVMIIPRDYNYLSIGTLFCIVACIAGVILGVWMCNIEDKYKPSSNSI